MMREDWLEFTAAGTVQESHLFPSQGRSPSPKIGGKNTKLIENDNGKMENCGKLIHK